MNNFPITNAEYPRAEIRGLNTPHRGLGRGRTYWILVIAVGVFFAVFLGGLILLLRELVPLEATPVEAECLIWLPRWPSGSSQQPTLEGFAIDENAFNSSEIFRSWILQKGIIIPPEVSIQLPPSKPKPPSREAHSSPGSEAGFFTVQLLCRADSPRQPIQELEALGQQIAQLWQSQWASAQRARQNSLLQILDHLRTDWTAQELQQEIFYESLAHWQARANSHLLEAGGSPPFGHNRSEEGLAQSIPAQQLFPHPELPSVPLVAPEVENPQWTALLQQLHHWQNRRQKLLQDRTPEHPAVQQADLEIAHTQQLLAQTPRWLSSESPRLPDGPPEQSGVSLLPSSVEESAGAARKVSTGTSGPPIAGEERDLPISPGEEKGDSPVRLGQPRFVSAQAGTHPVRTNPPPPPINPWQDGLLFGEIFLTGQQQARQRWEHWLAQAHQMLSPSDNPSSSGELIKIQSTVRPVPGWQMATLPAWAANWLWRLGAVSLLAALTAAGLSWAILAPHRPDREKPTESLAPSPTSNAAEISPNQADFNVSKATPNSSSFKAPEEKQPLAQPPPPPDARTLIPPPAGARASISSSLPSCTVSSVPVGVDGSTSEDQELQSLEECVQTIEELRAMLAVPVVGGECKRKTAAAGDCSPTLALQTERR